MKKLLDCTYCGFELSHEYDHEQCNTSDAKGCHENEFVHFNEIDNKVQSQMERNLI